MKQQTKTRVFNEAFIKTQVLNSVQAMEDKKKIEFLVADTAAFIQNKALQVMLLFKVY